MFLEKLELIRLLEFMNMVFLWKKLLKFLELVYGNFQNMQEEQG